jgi:MATE family multidrug resistance protein
VSSGRPSGGPDAHPFVERPHRTLLALALPVLLSHVAEPLAGLADIAFVARLGSSELAGLGVATTLLSGAVWIFGFLGIGAQTRVAHALGAGRLEDARETAGLVLWLSLGIGVLAAAVVFPVLGPAAGLMGAEGEIRSASVTYLGIRLLGLPGTLLMMGGFGVLRGLQDMRTPLWAAGTASVLNAVLDPLLIFGVGPFPRLGVAGAAWATTATQWLAAVWAVRAVRLELGIARHVHPRQVVALLVVGRDLFLRTGLLLLFLMLATRTATRAGAEAGAAHAALRQIWMLTAFVLGAYEATAQSLVGYFMGGDRVAVARRVAGAACTWGFGTGALLTLGMLLLEDPVARLLVPTAAHAVFAGAWWIAALAQPLNALAFVTDGIHWGTSDYRYLRNGMFLSTTVGAGALMLVDVSRPDALALVWGVTLVWAAMRGGVGLVRIWPAPGRSPLRAPVAS